MGSCAHRAPSAKYNSVRRTGTSCRLDANPAAKVPAELRRPPSRYAIGLTPRPNPEEPPPPPRVSVVVVSRNRVDRLRACLQSLEKSQGRERLQIIVVDNGSRDGSTQLETEFPNMQFSKLPKNFGLTKAMNIGWRAAEADYVFFLHEDTELEPDAIERLAGTLDAATEASGVCPLLLDMEGQPAPQLGNLPPEGQWRPAQPAGDEPMPVAYPRGAALMVRAFVIKSTRQID